MPTRLDAGAAGFDAAFARLLTARSEAEAEVDRAVAAILDDVAARGDAAVLELTERFDGVRVTADTMAVTPAELDAAVAASPPAALAALETAARRIRAFHARQRPDALDYIDDDGIRLGYRWTAIDAVGLYVPGGTAAYPSSVLMNAVPAEVAGVGRLVMVVPSPGGAVNPLVLAAARIAGVHEVYRIGGAQAIGALAFGTATIPAVDKIVGPGNAYVAAAKRRVFGVVGIDMIAGPSEVLVVADAGNDPAWIALDLLAQAEHDVAARPLLITDDAAFADAVCAAVAAELERLPRRAIAGRSWRDNGAVIVVDRLEQTLPLIDRLAPEHLQLAVADPEPLAARVRHAGAMFLGRFTPEAVGDYVAGPNHVLPTSRSARFSSGLGVLDFMKRTTLIACDGDGLAALAVPAIALAEAEGLTAHARSVAVRVNRRQG